MSTANKSTLFAAIGIAAFAGVVFGCLGGGITGYRIGKTGEDRGGTGAGPSATKSSTLPTRDEFRAKCIGKSKDEILKSLGRPVSTNETGRFEVWRYERAAYDPITGRTDAGATLWFAGDGRVSHVEF